MKLAITTLIVAMAMASIGKADGFYCASPDGNLAVKVFDHVHRNLGTRNAARMIVSNPATESGTRTLAVFSSEQGNLWSTPHDGQYLKYVGYVDLRYKNIRKEKSILNEPISNLSTVTLNIYFNYRRSGLKDGQEVMGALDLSTRDGRHLYSELTCGRYLKTDI